MKRWIWAAAIVPALIGCKSRYDNEPKTPPPAEKSQAETARGWDDKQGYGEFGPEGREAPSATWKQEREATTLIPRTTVGKDPNEGEAQANKTAEGLSDTDAEEGRHFNQTQHARMVPESAIELSAVEGSGKNPVKASAEVRPGGDGKAQVFVELKNARAGSYAVRLGGSSCSKTSSEDQAAAAPTKEGEQLGTIAVGQSGQGKLVATIESAGSTNETEDYSPRALTIAPLKGDGASEPIACGVVSLPEEEGRG